MAVHDVIGDMLTKIKNASNAGHRKVRFRYSKLKLAVSDILVSQGFLERADVVGSENKQLIEVVVRYFENKPVISGMKRISKPGRRVYRGSDDIPRFMNGLAVTIVSTSKGILTGKEAKETSVGGEVICYVW